MQDLIERASEGLNLDRSDWKLVNFGDVAIQQKQTVDRENTELTRYVKGEHMGSEDVHLREWGELKDEYLGPAFIRKFEEGDILYGSRRTYLRKVVLAPFEGITSNTTFVIKADEEFIDKRLLPYVMLSEGFSQHSIRNSKGSVNPYVNWKDLAGYEFLLPPKEQQGIIATLLHAIENLHCAAENMKSTYKQYADSSLDNAFFKKASNSKMHKLEKLCEKITYGFTNPMPTVAEGVYMVTATNIRDGEVDFENTRKTSVDAYENLITKKSRPNKGDVLVTKDGRLGELAVVGDELMCINQSVALLRPGTDISPEYLCQILKTKHYQNLMLRESGGSALKHIYITKVAKMEVPVPSLLDQKEICEKASNIIKKGKLINNYVNSAFDLKKSIINQVF